MNFQTLNDLLDIIGILSFVGGVYLMIKKAGTKKIFLGILLVIIGFLLFFGFYDST